LRPPISPLTTESLDIQEQFARSLFGTGQPTIDLGRAIQAGDFLDSANNPQFQAALEASLAPSRRSFTEIILPAIQSRAVQEGAFGGAREDLALSAAAGEQVRGEQDLTARLVFANMQREQARQLQAPSLIQAGIQQELLGPGLLATLGAERRGLEAEGIAEEIARFQEEINAAFRPLSPLSDILTGTNLGANVSGQTQSAYADVPSGLGGNLLTGALGGGLTGLAVGQAFPSFFGSVGGVSGLGQIGSLSAGASAGLYGIPIGLALSGLFN
jgi:hypothetical protein